MDTPWHFVDSKKPGMVWLVTAMPIVHGQNTFLVPREVATAAIRGCTWGWDSDRTVPSRQEVL